MGTKISYLGNEIASIDQNEVRDIKEKLAASKDLSATNSTQIPQNSSDIEELRSEVDLAKDVLGGAFDSFSDIQRIVRKGQAAKQFSVGDQLVCGKTVNGTTQKLVWDIIGIDQDTPSDPQFTHSLTLQLHDCYAGIQFSASQALFAFPDGLSAGTYHFTVGAQPWVAGDVGKTIMFTLTKDIPAGGQLVINNAYNKTMIGATISAFTDSLATTATETVTMSEGDNGTDLGTVEYVVNGNIGSILKTFLGSNNYSESAIRQWLNSDQPAGFWTPQTAFDRPPTWNSTVDGFLYGIDPEFLAVLGSVNKITALNNLTDGGGTIKTVEKAFLPSRSEVYAGNEGIINEGEPYTYYSDYSDLTTQGTGKDTNRIKYRNGTAQYWWLRSPNAEGANNVRIVRQAGELGNHYATQHHGAAPTVCIV